MSRCLSVSRKAYSAPACGLFGCCAGCAIHLESATYCERCAGSLLDVTKVRAADPFNLQ